MRSFIYKVTLKSGQFTFAENGILLDQLIRDRWEDVEKIELLPPEEEIQDGV